MKVLILVAALGALAALAASQAEVPPPVTYATTEEMPKIEEEGAGLVVPEFETFGEFRDWLITLTPAQRIEMFENGEAGPMPKGIYTGFMLSDRPNYEDFDISITNKAVMTFVFDRWIGKTFDGKGNLQNILRDEVGFTPDDLKGELILRKGYVDNDKSWIAEYGEETKYNFILDEFREIRPGFLYGITFLVPAAKGDKAFFECGLVRVAEKTPKGMTPSELILENMSEVEGTPESSGAENPPSTPEESGAENPPSTSEGSGAENPPEAPEVMAQDAAGEPEWSPEESEAAGVDAELKAIISMPEPEPEATELDTPETESLDSMMD